MAKKKEETEIQDTTTPAVTLPEETTTGTTAEETLINVLVLENHSCEIAGKKLDLKKGAKVQLTPFQFQVLSNPSLTQKIVQAI